MKTIKQISEHAIAALRSEPQLEFMPYCVWDGPDIILPKRIVERIYVEGTCWRVKGWNTDNGFANISVRRQNLKVHRVVFTLVIGPIPVDHILDHDKTKGCRYRDCCNPWHLTPVTVKENTHRGDAVLFRSVYV